MNIYYCVLTVAGTSLCWWLMIRWYHRRDEFGEGTQPQTTGHLVSEVEMLLQKCIRSHEESGRTLNESRKGFTTYVIASEKSRRSTEKRFSELVKQMLSLVDLLDAWATGEGLPPKEVETVSGLRGFLIKTLESSGIFAIPVELGDPFRPEQMACMGRMVSSQPEDTVVEIQRSGYELRTRTGENSPLRLAEVLVSSKAEIAFDHRQPSPSSPDGGAPEIVRDGPPISSPKGTAQGHFGKKP